MSVQNGAWIGNDTLNSAKAGNLSIRPVDFVELVGSGITTAALFGSAGVSGEIVIDTRRLIVRDASYIATTTFGSGKAGNITIKATESVELLRTPDGGVVPTLIASNSFGRGNGGDITIDTQRLIIRDGTGISSASGGTINNRVYPNCKVLSPSTLPMLIPVMDWWIYRKIPSILPVWLPLAVIAAKKIVVPLLSQVEVAYHPTQRSLWMLKRLG